MFQTAGVWPITAAFVFMVCNNAAGQWLYVAEVNFFDEGYVHRMSVDGSVLETLYETGGGLSGLALLPERNEAYTCDVATDVIARATLDPFGEMEVVVSGLTHPADLVASSRHGALAWSDVGTREVVASDLDGSDLRVLASDILSTSIAIDDRQGHVYFEDRATAQRGAIKRIRLDGTGLETIIDDVPTATDIALDVAHGYVYWGSSAGFDTIGGIYRVRFDGTGFEEVFKPSDSRLDATTLAIDAANEFVYFGLQNGGAGTAEVFRMGLGGEDPTFIRGGFEGITDITYLIPAPGGLAPLALAALLASRLRRA